MDNSSLDINHLGVDTAQYGDRNYPYHNMAGYPTPQVAGGHATSTGQLEGKLQLAPQDMLPYTYQELEQGGNIQAQHQTGGQAYATPQSALTPGSRDMEIRNASTATSQGVKEAQAQHEAQQPRHESPEDNRGVRSGSQMAEARYEEFGMNNPSATDGTDLGKGQKGEDKTGSPAWTELKTKAGKERKRLPLACIACRRKKIRCSGEKPACKHCLRSRIPCVYKVTTRKAAPRTDYMAMLDKRLKRMEERIIKIIPKEEQDLTTVVRAQVKPALPGTTPAKPATKKRPAEEAFSSELHSWANSERLSGQALVPTSLKAQEAEDNKLLVEGADALPPPDIQEHLANVFFDNVYGQAYHVLHKRSYMDKLKDGVLAPVLNLCVCAISARFSTHPKITGHPAFLRGESWATEARKIVLARYEWPNITILTCLLLLGLHEFGTCYGGRSWAFGGMAIRMAYALQLHRDLDYDPCKPNLKSKISPVDREIRRRTMWACFLMDRFNSSGTDRPMFIKEETIRIQLPVSEKLFRQEIEAPTEDLEGNVPQPSNGEDGQLPNARDNMGVAAFMIKSIAIWGRIIIYHFQGGRERDLYQMWEPESEFAKLKKQSEEFLADLPDWLKWSEHNLEAHQDAQTGNQFLFLHISCQQNMLLLNHNASKPLSSQIFKPQAARPSLPREFIMETGKIAYAAAQRISKVLEAADDFPLTAPFAGYCAFLSSSVQMTAAFSKDSNISGVAKRNLATNVRYLTKAKKYWGAFHWTSEQLKKQFKACADAAKMGYQDMAGAQAKSITMYGDWFDRYPHGVNQSDYEDPAVRIKQEKGDDAVLRHKSDLKTVEQFCKEAPQLGLLDGKAGGKKRKTTQPQQPVKSGSAPAGGTAQAPSPLAGQPITTPSPSYMQDVQHTQQQQQGQQPQLGHQNNPLQVPDQHGLLPQQQSQTSSQGYSSHLSPNFSIPPPQRQQSLPQHSHSPHPHHRQQMHQQHTQQQPQQPYYPTAADFSFPTHQMGLGMGIMPQLDRQLVYGAYNSSGPEMRGIDMNAALHGDSMTWDASPNPHQGVNPHHPASGAGQNVGQGGGGGARLGGQIWGGGQEQPTSAWFMPFNMQPPQDMGESDGFGLGLGGEQMGFEGQMEMGLGMGMGRMGQGGGPSQDGSMGGSNHAT